MNDPEENIFEPKIGLEIHAQLKTYSKLFCSCSTNKKSDPNKNICPICMGHPGTMPALNKSAVEMAIKAGLAMKCRVNLESAFDRKNYYYPDLPKGFQITQYFKPICSDGIIYFYDKKKSVKKISIDRIHIEEDAGKIIHTEKESLIDYNRSGIPLIEIVTKPEFNSPDDCFHFLKELKLILEFLDICDCNMQDGSLRVDVNISVNDIKNSIIYNRSEIKNLNSFKNVKDVLIYEFIKQKNLILNNILPEQETLLWDEKKLLSYSIRKKNPSENYRYIPEPDLPNLLIKNQEIELIKNSIPELPFNKQKRFLEKYELPIKHSEVLVSSQFLSNYFEDILKYSRNPKLICNWINTELLGLCNFLNIEIKKLQLPPSNFAKLINMIDDGSLSNLSAKEILKEILLSNDDPLIVASRNKLIQCNDKNKIGEIIEIVLNDNQEKIKEYKSGKTNLIGYFIGMVSNFSDEKVNPKLAREILQKKLDS